MERAPNKSQHTKLTLEKKILPPLTPGFELATFRSRVRRSNQQAIPAAQVTLPKETVMTACDWEWFMICLCICFEFCKLERASETGWRRMFRNTRRSAGYYGAKHRSVIALVELVVKQITKCSCHTTDDLTHKPFFPQSFIIFFLSCQCLATLV